MRNLYIYSILLLLLVRNTGNAQPLNGIVAHWPFNGNTNDSSGNLLHATATQSFYVPGIGSKAGTAFHFKDSLLMSVAYQAKLNLQKFSICAVLRPRTLSQDTIVYNTSFLLHRPLVQGNGAKGVYGMALTNYFAQYSAPVVKFKPDYCFYGLANNNLNNALLKDTRYYPATDTNRWYSIVATYDSLTFKIYVNGFLKQSFTGPGIPIDSSNAGLQIGCNFFTNPTPFQGNFYKGYMDDLCLYGRALADSEVIRYPFWVKDTMVALNTPFPDSVLCSGVTNMTANYLVSKNFRSGNVFTVQMSNASGIFAPAVNIGNTSSVTSGTINCTIPTGMPSGAYRIRILATTPADTSLEYDISVNPTPAPAIRIQVTNTTICQGDTVTFYPDTLNYQGSNPAYQWYINNSPVSGANKPAFKTHLMNNNDTVTCMMTSNHPCVHVPVTSNTIVMTVDPILIPSAKLIAIPSNAVPVGTPIKFTVNITHGGTAPLYQWKKNWVDIPGATNDTLTYLGIFGDRIFVKITSNEKCANPDTAHSDTMTVIYTGNVGDINNSTSFYLYPNPNNGIFSIVATSTLKDTDISVEVVNVTGQVVYFTTARLTQTPLQLDLSQMPIGIYLLKLRTEKGLMMQRFTIER
jgi:hypothetical protein